VGLSITTLRKVYCYTGEKKLKSVNIWQSYKQEGGCLMNFVRLATTPLKDEEFTRLLEYGEKQLLLTGVLTLPR